MGIFEKEIWQLTWNKLVNLYQHDSFSKQKFSQSIVGETKIKEEKMEESLGLGKKSYGTEHYTKTWSWFRLPIPTLNWRNCLEAQKILVHMAQLIWLPCENYILIIRKKIIPIFPILEALLAFQRGSDHEKAALNIIV